jgi:hypothetical protein
LRKILKIFSATLIFLAASFLASAQAQEQINVRGWSYPDFGRIVFDWGAPFDYGIDYDGTKVNIIFSRAFRASLSGASGSLKSYISDMRISPEKTSIILFADSPFSINSFTTNNTLVIDFIPLKDGQQPQRQIAGQLNVSDWLEQKGEITENVAITEVTIDDPDIIFSKGINPEDFQPETTRIPARKDPEEEIVKEIRQNLVFKPLNITDLPPVLGSYYLPFTTTTGAAVFRRGRYLWFIFDNYIEVPPLEFISRSRNALSSVEQLPIADATVLRTTTKPGLNPVLRRGPNGTGWIVDFYERELGPLNAVEVGFDLGNIVLGPQIIFPALNIGRLVFIEDPDMGDNIRVLTYLEPGAGVPWTRRLPELNILKTAQGVALEFFKDTTAVSTSLDSFVVSDRTGLHLSALTSEQFIPKIAAKSSSDASKQFSTSKVFRFIEWQGDPKKTYYEKYTDYLFQISARDIKDRVGLRVDLARFLIAHGNAHDTLGLLNITAEENPTSTNTQDFIAVRGIANLMAHRTDAAAEDLFDSRLDDIQEIYVWRGVWYAKNAQWGKAEASFRLAENIYRLYPAPILGFVGLPRLDTSLALRDIDFAKTLFPIIDNNSAPLSANQVNALKYQQGRISMGDGDISTAEQLWSEVANQYEDDFNGARAEYALLSLYYREKKVQPNQLSRQLDRLRYRWRGDRFELNVLNQIAEIELASGDYREGLRVLRQAVSFFSSDPLSAKLTQRMEAIFSSLFRDNLADKMPPLKALSLFDEFRELTPPNRNGNLMIENLVDRLIGVDLLNEAANLLAYQIDFRLDGIERARVGLKLAIIYLIDNHPSLAIDVLDSTAYPQLPQTLQDDRRRVRAKAHYELNNIQEATLLIAGDLSLDADLIRQDIYWEQANWLEVAKVMQRLAGPPPQDGEKLNNTRARVILYWAVALILDENTIDLEGLLDNFQEAMLESEYASVFSFIINTGEKDSTSIRELVNKLADSERFDDFINTYRTRLRDKVA